MAYRSITGSVVLGNRIRNDRLAREQVYVLSIVIDQFAATMHNRREELLRQQVERKILQQEKLSVLGLLSGSLAHELRNPLSSIRTITTLVLEDLGQSHESRRDLQMVVDEIDRLSQTTNRLLDYSRPEPQTQAKMNPHRVISRIVCVLEYLAKQYHVETKLNLVDCDVQLESNDAALSEIVFNLVKNAIEAARDVESGFVEIRTNCDDGDFVLSVCDNGSGIARECQANLFQPFATYKVDGNGLGLYAVNERVRELGGRILFRPHEPCGTVFEVRLPMARDNDHSGC
jgi:C4-dicarboxylate-specific signal transduction histidine kinase